MSSSSYIIDTDEDYVRTMLEGMKYTYPGLLVEPDHNIVMLKRNRKQRVGLICGAGAGLEPFGAGFVGEGMLTGYVYGELFKAPSVENISILIENVALLNRGGVLVLLLNYPKQVLNFGLAIERARLRGIRIESFVITDDCSKTGDELVAWERDLTLRRGLSGAAFVIKILGNMSSLGRSMEEILEQAMLLNFRLATIGFSMAGGVPPGKSKPMYRVAEGEVAVGCGLQGDRGVRDIKANKITDIVKELLPKTTLQSGLKQGDSVCVLVNDMGAMTEMEMYALANQTDVLLGNMDLVVQRLYVGRVMTSLNTRGALLSLLNCTGLAEWLSHLDACTEAFAWPGSRLSKVDPKWPLKEYNEEEFMNTASLISFTPIDNEKKMLLNCEEAEVFKKCLQAACEALIANEDVLNKLNALTGNGDMGSNLRSYAEELQARLEDAQVYTDVAGVFDLCSSTADEKMSGSLGTLYAIALRGASEKTTSWLSCWKEAVSRIMAYTSARVGSRTLLDTLVPALEKFVDKIKEHGADSWREALRLAVKNAECGCVKTADMAPKVGRAKFTTRGQAENIDAGAYAVYVWLKAVYETLITETNTAQKCTSPNAKSAS